MVGSAVRFEEAGSEEIMSSRQTAALAGLCGTIVLAGLVAAGHISESATNNAGASDGAAVFASAHSGLIRAPEVIATPIDTPQIASADESGVTVADVAIVNAPPLVAGSNEEGSAADAAMGTAFVRIANTFVCWL